MSAYPSLWHAGSSGIRRRLPSLVAGLGFVLVAACYLAVASYVVFDLHIGHVVQDGVDTGDLLAVPFVLAATCSLVLATYAFAHSDRPLWVLPVRSGRSRRHARRAQPLPATPPPEAVAAAGADRELEERLPA